MATVTTLATYVYAGYQLGRFAARETAPIAYALGRIDGLNAGHDIWVQWYRTRRQSA